MSDPRWTEDRPKNDGFYWYREHGNEPEVVLWDIDTQWIFTAGSDIMMGDDMTNKIEGEFWSEPIKQPN